MSKVFISYSSKDAAVAASLVLELKSRGIEAWIDKIEIEPGDHISARIRGGLAGADTLLQIVSPNSVESSWVANESEWARSQCLRLIRVITAPIDRDGLADGWNEYLDVDLTRSDAQDQREKLMVALGASPRWRAVSDRLPDLQRPAFFEFVETEPPIVALVLFYQPLAKPSRDMLPGLLEIARSSGRVRVAVVDATRETSLADELGIERFPTLLFYRSGVVVARLVGKRPRIDVERILDEVRDRTARP